MRSIVRRLASLLAIAAIATALSAGTAAAAPVNAPNAQVVALDCGDAGAFDVVVNGSGAWSPGHLLDGNGVVIPVAFGEETTTVRDAEGTVVDQFTDPAIAKGKGKARARNRTSVECTYSLSFTEDGNTITVTGSAAGFLTGRPAS
ncbi:MAG TPA: hypothetical protein VKB03_10120 [Conexibacter sp.]|nr:hypothetical protein [Conexibacter sp.]